MQAFKDYQKDQTFDCDVVVVGTGAGGAVVGAELAEAGYDVVFVEEGGYHATESFNPYMSESIPRLYRDGGVTVIMGKPPIPYVEGRTVGGSTVVNGGMAYRPPERILAEWEQIMGTPELGVAAFEDSLTEVEERVNVSHQLDMSVGEDSNLMRNGAKKLGWEYSVNRRNQKACVGANNCGNGCPTGAKQSMLVTYLPRAFEAGARCLTEVRVEKLLIEGGRAVGVIGRAIDPQTRRAKQKITVRARAVVVSAGAVQTPNLLLRHRLGRQSGLLGRNFLCHPNAKVVAIFPHDVEGWKGVSQYGQIREFHDEGILFAENFVTPGVLATSVPFHGKESLDFMKDYRRMSHTGVLVEDSTSGRVRRSPFGPIVSYNITDQDHANFLRGVRLLSQLHFEMGAERVLLPFRFMPWAHSVDDLKKIDKTNVPIETLELFTPHLMGTCRIGSTPENSVVNLRGEAWDLPGCYVADASLFPTAIGVNPQITIMALATRIARRVELNQLAA